MGQPDFDSIPNGPPRDLSRTMLPKNLVAVVIGLAFLPIILNGLGFSFSAVSPPPAASDDAKPPLADQVLIAQQLSTGAIIYVFWNGRRS